MTKIHIFLLTLTLLTMSVRSENVSRQLTEREKLIVKINYELAPSMVTESLKKWNNEIQRGFQNEKPVSGLDYYSFYTTSKEWKEYRWFIADTGFSRKWLSKISELLIYMGKTQTFLSAEKFNGRTNTAKYKQAQQYFDVAYKRFLAAIKKPVKVSGKLQRKAKLDKALWQKEMRKKYKIDKKTEADLL